MDAISRAGWTTGRALKGLAVSALAAGAGLAAIFSARSVKDALDYAASIGEVAAQLGVTQRELQVYRYAATQVNLTQEEMEKGLAKLTLSIGKAGAGAKAEAQAFAALGVSITDIEGKTRPTGEVMLDLADRLAAIPDPAQRAAAVFAIFGRQGQKLIPLLEGGSKGLQEFARQAEEAGAIIADGDIAKADQTADKIEALNKQLQVNFSRTVAANADAIGSLAGSLNVLLGQIVEIGAWFARNPRIAALIFGGAVGGRVAGLPGAIVGGATLFLTAPDGTRSAADIRKEIDALQKRGPVVAGGSPGVLGELFTVRSTKKDTAAYQKQLKTLQADLKKAEAAEKQMAAEVAASSLGPANLFGSTGRGGGGAGSRASRNEAAKVAGDLAGLRRSIEEAFDTTALPESTRAANDLRDKLADIAESARKAGVPMSNFSGEVATLQARISELETEGLAREATEFSDAVAELGRDVNALDTGALSPLETRLDDVDDRYGALRKTITKQIEANQELAKSNKDAASTMAELGAMLVRLDAAHERATEAAKAQYKAEQRISDIAAQGAAQRIRNDITDLQQAGDPRALFTSNQREMQRLERELTEERIGALHELETMQRDLMAAEEANNQNEVARLKSLIPLQQELYDLAVNTSAQQIIGAQRVQDVFEDFTNSLSDELYRMISEVDFSFNGLISVFRRMLNDLFLRPAVDSLSSTIGGFFKSLFAGRYAAGGIIPQGEWGIVGERGPEPIFAADGPLRVLPNETFGAGGRGDTYNINVSGAMSEREARRTGQQIASAAAQRQAQARRAGIAGAV